MAVEGALSYSSTPIAVCTDMTLLFIFHHLTLVTALLLETLKRRLRRIENRLVLERFYQKALLHPFKLVPRKFPTNHQEKSFAFSDAESRKFHLSH